MLAIPSDVTASGLFINKSLFKKAGVSFPTSPEKTWTWTEFIEAADKVREKTGAKYSLTFDQSPSRLRAMVYEMGGKYVHADSSGKFSVDAATKKAVNYFVGLNDDKTMPKSVWTSGADPSAMFQSGDVVAYWSGVWQVPAFAESVKKFEWASVPTPAAAGAGQRRQQRRHDGGLQQQRCRGHRREEVHVLAVRAGPLPRAV